MPKSKQKPRLPWQGLLSYGESNYLSAHLMQQVQARRVSSNQRIAGRSLKNATRLRLYSPVDCPRWGCRKFLGIHSVGLLASA